MKFHARFESSVSWVGAYTTGAEKAILSILKIGLILAVGLQNK